MLHGEHHSPTHTLKLSLRPDGGIAFFHPYSSYPRGYPNLWHSSSLQLRATPHLGYAAHPCAACQLPRLPLPDI